MLEYGEPASVIDVALGPLVRGGLLAGHRRRWASAWELLYYAPANLPYFVPTRLSAARAAERFRGLYKLF